MQKDLIDRLRDNENALQTEDQEKLIRIKVLSNEEHYENDTGESIGAVYVADGYLTAVVNGRRLSLSRGELLLVNRYSHQEVLPSEKGYVAVGFSISSGFLDVVHSIAGKDVIMADFLAGVLGDKQESGEYLRFQIEDHEQIQNLLDNLIVMMTEDRPGNDKLNETTVSLIYLHLLEMLQRAETRKPNLYENMISMSVLNYIEQNYRDGTLTELCEKLNLPMHMLSRMIKKTTGFNYKELLQRKRLNKSVQLLCDTDMPISEIILAVGYENNSYFHRMFRDRYHMTPRAFRARNYKNKQIRL